MSLILSLIFPHTMFQGTGWWSFELCYGKTVKQYHLEGGKRVTNILLGKWVKTEHMTWLEKNPAKRPRAKPNRK